MNPMTTSFVVFVVVFSGALMGIAIRPILSKNHLNPASKNVVALTMGLVGTMAALVLGLLIASAKTSYDDKNSQIKQITAKIILLDNLFAQYGSGAQPARQLLRKGIEPLFERIWNQDLSESAKGGPFVATAVTLAFIQEVERLQPQNDSQRSLQSRAIQTLTDISQARLLLFAQAGKSIHTVFLVILVFWLVAIFASYTLFTPSNAVVVGAIFICALSVAGSIFLILAMDDPFSGLMAIPSAPLLNALPPLGS
jgi:hypothetical protein